MYERTIFKTHRSFEKYGYLGTNNIIELNWANLNELAKYNRITYLGNFPDDKQEWPFALFAITKGNDVLNYYCVELH